MRKKVAYVGFSNVDGRTHLSATNGGVAQSDFTHEILNEIFDCDYYVAQSEKTFDLIGKNKKLFRLRTGFIGNLIDGSKLAFLLKKNGPYEVIFIYHSLLYYFTLILLRLLGCKIVLQLNEIFYRGRNNSSRKHKIIESLMLRIPKKFIIATHSLRSFIDKNSEILAVIPGPIYLKNYSKNNTERNEENYQQLKIDCIRMVYAGIIDIEKNGGAFIAVQLASKLNSKKFAIDIYGFGSENDINALYDLIKKNNTSSFTKVRYCGALHPSQMISRLENYHVGLATQYIGTQFSESSFPSKILTYLSAGLNVVSATSTAIESWEHSDLLLVYKDIDLDDLVEIVSTVKIKTKMEITAKLQLMRAQILNNITRRLQ